MLKLKNLALLLFLFSLPLQTAIHFWLPESYLSGLRLDYLAITLYLSDLAALFYWFVCLRDGFSFRFSLPFTLILSILTLSHGLSFLALFWFVKGHLYQQLFFAMARDKSLFRSLKISLTFSLVLLGSVALSQFLFQRSSGGFLSLLGERPLYLSAPQVAQIELPFLGPLLRPYSLFPHPNSFAGFLLVVLVLLTHLGSSFFLLTLISFLILLTFSKAGILALSLLVVNVKPAKILILGFLLTLTIYYLSPLVQLLPANLERSFQFRLDFLQTTANLDFVRPEGLGYLGYFHTLANVLPASRQNYTYLQPVHNSFVLAILELGPILFLLVYLYLKKRLQPSDQSLIKNLIIVIVTTSLLDHYWWTLQQNQLIIFVSFVYLSQNYALRKNYH